ncbi:hypothetical protein DFH07DRAFT_780442 [Mycena maculata]|uniref:Uncharacterized protein n=1 Tax=Mycena maculata TaxID=230809 RepID=A0AAD7I303_9AGAR|nr:hypothetical protein DFH07DRAFT_780442 [Mycena maculata]
MQGKHKAFLKWLDLWRDGLLAWGAFSANLANQPFDYLLTHSYLVEVEMCPQESKHSARSKFTVRQLHPEPRRTEQMRAEFCRITDGPFCDQLMEQFKELTPGRRKLRVVAVCFPLYFMAEEHLHHIFPDDKELSFSDPLSIESRLLSTALLRAWTESFAEHVQAGNVWDMGDWVSNEIQNVGLAEDIQDRWQTDAARLGVSLLLARDMSLVRRDESTLYWIGGTASDVESESPAHDLGEGNRRLHFQAVKDPVLRELKKQRRALPFICLAIAPTFLPFAGGREPVLFPGSVECDDLGNLIKIYPRPHFCTKKKTTRKRMTIQVDDLKKQTFLTWELAKELALELFGEQLEEGFGKQLELFTEEPIEVFAEEFALSKAREERPAELAREEQIEGKVRRRFFVITAHMLEERVNHVCREGLTRQLQLQLLRELEDEHNLTEAKNQKKKERKRGQKQATQAKEAQRAAKAAERAKVAAEEPESQHRGVQGA